MVKELRLQILLHYHRKPDGSEGKGQCRRWSLAKAFRNLEGAMWSSQLLPVNVNYVMQ